MPLAVISQVAAGDTADFEVAPGEAVRIFTGAVMPAGTDTVVMQEQTQVVAGQLYITGKMPERGMHVRAIGAEIKQGALALPAGTLLTPPAIGFLAMLGLHQVWVHPRPAITLLVTGKELQAPGTTPQKGKVYEANSYALKAALAQLGVGSVHTQMVPDSLELTTRAVAQALESADMVLITGGISVGDYDFVLPAVLGCGVQQIFHKVKQRPGKPLFFGMAGPKPVFALPGNPSSVLSCFYQYVVAAISLMQGKGQPTQQKRLPLTVSVDKQAPLSFFMKGIAGIQGVTPLGAQESYRLSSFALANCLIEIPEAAVHLPAGTLVDVWMIG